VSRHHTPPVGRTDAPPPSCQATPTSSRKPSPKKGRGNTTPARQVFRLTSPYGASFDTILYRIEINHDGRHATPEEGHAALLRMAQYCRIHGAEPHLRRRETYTQGEEQVLYVRIMTDPSAWGRLRHQAQRLGLIPRLVKDTNEIPPADDDGPIVGTYAPLATLVARLRSLDAGEERRTIP